MLVAVTGAGGFIGGHLVRGLEARGWRVRPLLRPDCSPDKIERALAGVDVVVHAAAKTRAPTVAELVASNVDLTRRVAEAANRANAKRVILLSSQAAAGPAVALDRPVTEADAPSPIEEYGKTKLAAERRLRDVAPSSVVLRLAAVYGPADRDFLEMFRLANRGFALHAANAAQWISIVHVDDVVAAVATAATDERAAGQTFFVANPEPIQWRALYAEAARAMGKTLVAEVELPRWLVIAGAHVGDAVAHLRGQAGLWTSRKVALAQAPFWVCSTTRIRDTLGFATSVALREGLSSTYHWYRENHWL